MPIGSDSTITLSIVAKDLASGNITKAVSGLDALAKKGGLVGSMAQGVGIQFGMMANPVYLAGRAISSVTDFMGGAVEKASDMAESQSKVDVVFGESAGAIHTWGETAARAMGSSNQAALEAAGTLGNLLLSMGKTEAEAAEMSMTMVQLAGDLASFNNVPIEDVLTAMRSGLTGEIAPLRRFGVSLTENALKAKAFAMGLSDGVGVLDASAKSAAAYALILEQTGTAQGDYARTADGLANTQRTNAALWEDIQTLIGEQLIPVVRDLGRAVRDDLLPAFKELGNVGDAFNNINRWVNPEVARMQDLREQYLATADAIGLTEEQIEGVIDDLHDYWDRTDVEFTAADIEARIARIKSGAMGMGDAFREGFGTIAAVIEEASKPIASFERMPFVIADQFRSGGPEMAAAASSLFDPIHSGARDAVDAAIEEARTLGPGVRDEIRSSKSAVRAAMQEIRWAIEHPMAQAKEQAWLEARLASRNIRRGLASSNPDTREDTRQLVAYIKARIAELENLDPRVDVTMGVSGGWSAQTRRENFNRRKRHSGGHVEPHEAYVVGGPGAEELLVMGDQGGHVYAGARSLAGGRSGGSGGWTVNLNLSSLLPPTIAQMQAAARAFLPELVREARRQGISLAGA